MSARLYRAHKGGRDGGRAGKKTSVIWLEDLVGGGREWEAGAANGGRKKVAFSSWLEDLLIRTRAWSAEICLSYYRMCVFEVVTSTKVQSKGRENSVSQEQNL